MKKNLCLDIRKSFSCDVLVVGGGVAGISVKEIDLSGFREKLQKGGVYFE